MTDWFDRLSTLDTQLIAVVGGVILLLVVASRIPAIRQLLSLGFTVGLLAIGALIISEQSGYNPTLARISSALGLSGQQVTGEELRIRMAPDGHFWVRASIDGVERRLLVDSGATVTAISPAVAAQAGLDERLGVTPVLINTANGTITGRTAEIAEFRLGNIVARDLAAVVSPAFGQTNVLGMNFLSRLRSWRVEGRTLILVPHNPQPVT